MGESVCGESKGSSARQCWAVWHWRVYFTAPYTGVYIPVSRLSVAVSAVLGVPGVTLLVLLSLL
mgnify:CR=1 FL=1